MINRPDYIEAVKPFIDKPLVKILAGVRRCGKSTIFEMLKEEFLRRGVSADHIICKRYTEMDIPESITAKQMYDELTAAMLGKGHCYLLLDEIQEIDGWEKAVMAAGPPGAHLPGVPLPAMRRGNAPPGKRFRWSPRADSPR